jgi:mxaA protein
MNLSIAACPQMASAIVAIAIWMAPSIVHADSPADLNIALPPNAVVEQPRPFGYVVGDVLRQRVLLQLDGHAFEPATLPGAERISAWLERRPLRVEATSDGRRWLNVDYQVINAPQAMTLVRIPSWELKAKSGADQLTIGEWPVSVSALTPRSAYAKGALEELRRDRPAPTVATDPIRRQIAIWSSALVVTVALWLGLVLWRNWRAAAARPFARALREIRRIDERAPEAWQVLHRAFDRTAGRVTQTATLQTLFQRAPQLTPLRPKIEQFFEQSNERFFGRGLPDGALSVRKLCAELRRIEKSHDL